jgi:LPS O-antigen subunit length determinant protein (WzzB/FepE family)
MKTLSTKAR